MCSAMVTMATGTSSGSITQGIAPVAAVRLVKKTAKSGTWKSGAATPGGPKSGAPVYGEHTREILAEHGLSQAEIETLLDDGAVAAA